MTTKYVSLEEIEKLLKEKYGFGKFQLDSIRELPSLDIDSLQRYDFDYGGGYGVDNKGDWIKYDDLKKLLGR